MSHKNYIGRRICVREEAYPDVPKGSKGTIIEYKYGVFTVIIDGDSFGTQTGLMRNDFEFIPNATNLPEREAR